MTSWILAGAALAALSCAGAAQAQDRAVQPVQPVQPYDAARQTVYSDPSQEPDVLLDIPNLSVEEIQLEVEGLEVHLALDARLANLLQLTAGADARIERVNLTISGVQATVLLKVRLDNVAQIIDRTLTTIDRNPELLERLLQSVDHTVTTVGGVAGDALQPGGVLSQTVNTLGQTVQTTVGTTGQIVERTLDTSGAVVNQRTVGDILDTGRSGFAAIGESTDSQGRTVRRLRNDAGVVVEAVLDQSGRIVSTRTVGG